MYLHIYIYVYMYVLCYDIYVIGVCVCVCEREKGGGEERKQSELIVNLCLLSLAWAGTVKWNITTSRLVVSLI